MTRTTLATALLSGASLIALPASAQDDSGPAADLCETGFYEADLNDDGIVTQDELQKAARAAFDVIDADDSGEVTAEEYEACINQSAGMRAMPSDRSEENFAEYDTDGDGELGQEEFMNAAVDASESAGDLPAEGMPSVEMRRFVFIPESMSETDASDMSAEETAARASILFIVLDRNADKVIGPAEWARQESLKNDIADVLNMEFSAADRDQSGTLSPQEFMAREEEKRAAAEERAREHGAESDAGAPVVYYRYPGVM